MPLPPDFQFSQSSLQDYQDCARRFELRYILRQKWPALQSEPVLDYEHHVELGTRFHRLVHQKLLGIPDDFLEAGIDDPDLLRWWQVFKNDDPLKDLPALRLPEYRLAAAFAGQRLVAQYDLLSIEPGHRAIILDWKTSTRRTPSTTLTHRLQTRLYPFLLTLAGTRLNNGLPLKPEQIELRYWFPCAPDKPEIVGYTQDKYQQDHDFLIDIIQQITQTPDGLFLLTPLENHCKFCEYRSLCDRGRSAGDWQENQDAETPSQIGPTLDMEEIGEIIF